MDTLKQAFLKARARLEKAVKAISMIENLASSQYDKTENQVEYINNTLSEAVVSLYNRFNKTTPEKTVIAVPKA